MDGHFQQAAETMRRTYHDLDEEKRRALVDLLNLRLATAIDLRIQAKQAHWNVRGPRFIALHELFDQIASAGSRFQDLIGERVAQLGGFAAGTVEAVSSTSSLATYPLELSWEEDHVRCVADSLARFAASMRVGIGEAQGHDDEATVDILTEITRETDKLLWFVEAHLESREQAETLESHEAAERGNGGEPASS
jgi:starvation-inducible DNA-binding protein